MHKPDSNESVTLPRGIWTLSAFIVTLGQSTDHTLNTPTSHFLYWYRSVQTIRVRVDGIINLISTPEKLTALGVALIGCSEGLIWSVKKTDSNGWQTVNNILPNNSCSAMLSFFVSSNATEDVSVNFDDILLDFCGSTTAASSSTMTITLATVVTSTSSSAVTPTSSSTMTPTATTLVTTTCLGTILRCSHFLLWNSHLFSRKMVSVSLKARFLRLPIPPHYRH
ncbi:unnamed protein product [Rotaria magnacalcarata]|uniref:Uncharacterized protein n=1 Tax=Rotaria magnacalcarata TaxID=392030 RepID=A0A816N0P0_9BILA|nr:unnamed protein product [Rotaria magnacalcarata]